MALITSILKKYGYYVNAKCIDKDRFEVIVLEGANG
jgi:hypothetical protein